MIKDLLEAFRYRDLWVYLAWNDIIAKYRRTTLGPFWIIAVTFVSIGCMAVLGSILFKTNLKEFLPHVACGMVVWGYIGALIMESCGVFIGQAGIIQNVRLPVLAFVLRMFMRNTFLFAHSLIIVLLIVLYAFPLTLNVLFIIPAFIFCAINSISFGVILGFFSARYRDVMYIIQTILNIMMLITPIMWKREMLGEYMYLADANPFTHFIALFREPLLGNPVPNESLIYVSALTVLSFALASYLYRNFKNRLVFWL